MNVLLAKSAGFCYGVERAVKLAEQVAAEKGGCVMLGSIVLLWFFTYTKFKVERWEGAVLTILFLAYMTWLVVNA